LDFSYSHANAIACNGNGDRDNFDAMSPPTSIKGKESTPPALNFKSPHNNIVEIFTKPPVQSGFRSINKNRVLNSSVSFDRTRLVPLLYTAILCALKAMPQEQSKLKIPFDEN